MGQDILGIDYDISMGFEVLRFLVRGTLSLLFVYHGSSFMPYSIL